MSTATKSLLMYRLGSDKPLAADLYMFLGLLLSIENLVKGREYL